MTLCPFAVHKLLPENKTQAPIDPDQVIYHTAVDALGATSLFSFFAGSITLESHFFIKMNGVIEQYMDTRVRADANRYANSRAISIETEDEGDPARIPWSSEQVKALVRLTDWLCDTHPKILRRKCPAWDQAGIGYHSMWGAPSPWTPSAGKTCPGAARIPQVPSIIAAVASANTTPIPVSVPTTKDYEDMHIPAMLVQAAGDPKVWVTDNLTKQHVQNREHMALLLFLGTAKAGEGGKPFVWSAAAINSIRTVS